jgi:hypothetical protein
MVSLIEPTWSVWLVKLVFNSILFDPDHSKISRNIEALN